MEEPSTERNILIDYKDIEKESPILEIELPIDTQLVRYCDTCGLVLPLRCFKGESKLCKHCESIRQRSSAPKTIIGKNLDKFMGVHKLSPIDIQRGGVMSDATTRNVLTAAVRPTKFQTRQISALTGMDVYSLMNREISEDEFVKSSKFSKFIDILLSTFELKEIKRIEIVEKNGQQEVKFRNKYCL
ncbi:hypothetical protein [Eremococcus coleocola]|uniref:hypothetical protein n=1 Tax=Eremococcus coleocola TaxID=88132 RepID=UPI00048450A1|nr:hypothetical protein [Eremococcus coleocola]